MNVYSEQNNPFLRISLKTGDVPGCESTILRIRRFEKTEKWDSTLKMFSVWIYSWLDFKHFLGWISQWKWFNSSRVWIVVENISIGTGLILQKKLWRKAEFTSLGLTCMDWVIFCDKAKLSHHISLKTCPIIPLWKTLTFSASSQIELLLRNNSHEIF